jgi:hypothetical protein
VLGLVFVPVTKFSRVDDPAPAFAALFQVASGTVAMAAVFVLALPVIQLLRSEFSCPLDMRMGPLSVSLLLDFLEKVTPTMRIQCSL